MEKDLHRKKLFVSLFTPLVLALLMCIIRIAEDLNHLDFYKFSIEPRTFTGLVGIIFAPLLHANWEHLLSNLFPFVLLFACTIYFYRLIAYRVFILIWLFDGVGVWLLGRDSYHLGASGVVYGLASFLFFSGVLRKNRSLLALSLVVISLYGGLIWGMFPQVYIFSWEAHVFGFLSGLGLAVWYRKTGPTDDRVPEWFNEEEKDELPPVFPQQDNNSPAATQQPQIIIKYDYKANNPEEQGDSSKPE